MAIQSTFNIGQRINSDGGAIGVSSSSSTSSYSNVDGEYI